MAAGELLIEPVLDSHWGRIAELTAQYDDLPLGVVDASISSRNDRVGELVRSEIQLILGGIEVMHGCE